MKEVYTKHLSAPGRLKKGKEQFTPNTRDTAIQIELEESPKMDGANSGNGDLGESGNALVAKDPHHAAEAEMMVPMKGSRLPAIRVDGPYGTASG
jgi:hypothetical protein